MNIEAKTARPTNQEDIQVHGPIESRRLLLEKAGRKGGLSIKSAYRFAEKKNLWFGISEDVVTVLSINEELGYVRYDPKKKRYFLIGPNPYCLPK